MNMLSHSMASQLLALQSHWAANIAQGMSISPEQMEQYSQMLSRGTLMQSVMAAGASGAAGSAAGAVVPAAAAPAPGQEAPKPDEPAVKKSLLEMMEEDFEPDGIAVAGDGGDGGDGGDREGGGGGGGEATTTTTTTTTADAAQGATPAVKVARVGSLSGWIPPTGGNSPTKAGLDGAGDKA